MSRRVRKARPQDSGQAGLVLVRPRDRAAVLGLERDRLLKEIRRRRKELDRIESELEAVKTETRTTVGLLVDEQLSVEQEIHLLFAALLAPGRLAKRKQKHVRGVYRSLQESGLIAPNVAEGHVAGGPEHESDNDGETAQKPPDHENHRALRTLFKRLVVALHPDFASLEEEKKRRTAVMKDVTRAYEEGDLARMIELGERLPEGPPLTKQADDPALPVSMLERTLIGLKAQLRGLLDELRLLRRSEPFLVTKDLQRFKRAGGDPWAMLKEEEQAQLDELIATRDFVAAFHAGKMSFDEFLEGPSLPSDAGPGAPR